MVEVTQEGAGQNRPDREHRTQDSFCVVGDFPGASMGSEAASSGTE